MDLLQSLLQTNLIAPQVMFVALIMCFYELREMPKNRTVVFLNMMPLDYKAPLWQRTEALNTFAHCGYISLRSLNVDLGFGSQCFPSDAS